MRELKFDSTVKIYEDYSSFSEEQLSLFEAAKKATLSAYAPYSNFYVGAALLLENGKIISGNNQENAVYPLGLCAERVAMFHSTSQYPDLSIVGLAVTIDYDRCNTKEIAFPCGSCRQAIVECEQRFKTPIKIFLLGPKSTVWELENAQSILPFAFTSDML